MSAPPNDIGIVRWMEDTGDMHEEHYIHTVLASSQEKSMGEGMFKLGK